MLNGASIDKLLIRNSSVAVASAFSVLATAALADTPMTGRVVMEKMTEKERFFYVSGIVEGLAYARYLADGKKEDGLKCIHDWFFRGSGEAALKVYDAFEHYLDYPPTPVVWVLVKKQCGE